MSAIYSSNPRRDFPDVQFSPIYRCPKHLVGTDGTVWSRRQKWKGGRWKQLTYKQTRRHYQINLFNEKGVQRKRYVHRLVLEAFVGPCPEGLEACHYPHPTSDALENLRWDTRQANAQDSIKSGTHVAFPCGERHPLSKLTKSKVKKMRRMRAKGMTYQRLADAFGVSQRTAYYACTRRTWK